MELIVLSSEKLIHDEAFVLNQLFHHGLNTLHLRKNSCSLEEYKGLIEKINKEYHARIVVHDHHELCEVYALKGIHLKESYRKNLAAALANYLIGFTENGFTTSTSFHQPEDIKKYCSDFNYAFLSPVFDSITKKGYRGRGFDVHDMNHNVVALGGVDHTLIQAVSNMGYCGVGVLGGIWNNDDYLNSFLAVKSACQNIIKLKV